MCPVLLLSFGKHLVLPLVGDKFKFAMQMTFSDELGVNTISVYIL